MISVFESQKYFYPYDTHTINHQEKSTMKNIL